MPDYSPCTMNKQDLDRLRVEYQAAVDAWVSAIRAEEALATADHSEVAMEKWDAAHFAEHDAHTKADNAREAYKDGLRAVNYGI
jgi:crotonobetainyl-CoA:carnitine CoA-transferase CaiB-like acyl-CoA transferase